MLAWKRRPALAGHGVLSALVLTLTLTSSALADQPFKASMSESFVPVACPAGTLCANALGRGNAAGMGNTTETSLGIVDLARWSSETGCAPEAATTTLMAANGDQLFLTTNGAFCQTGPTTAVDSGTYQVTGGTGRFAGARGSGAYVTQASMTDGTSVTTMNGNLTLRD